jgi:hypothetical protein
MELNGQIVNPDLNSGHIFLVLDGKDYSINAGNSSFSKALEAYNAKDWESFIYIVNPEIRLKSLYASYEGIEVKDGNLYVFGDPIHSTIAKRVISFIEHGLDCVHLFKFILKLNMNPSKRAVDELYTFLEHRALPVTDNGNFLAYKAVRADYTDKYTGKFLNTIDSVLEMPRNKVDDNKENGCSYGFHAGSVDYAKDFMNADGHLMIVEINPADVVSIPTDCQYQKLRTCKYKVVGEYEIDLNDPMYASRFQTDQDDDVDLWDDEEDEDFLCPNCECDKSDCDDCYYCDSCCDCDKGVQKCGHCGTRKKDLDEDFYCEDCQVEPKIEIQLQLNLDNKIQEDDWKTRRFEYIKMLNFLYSNRRPAVANAMRNFYSSVSHHHLINPEFNVLLNFTSDEDAHKIYLEYTS